MTHYPAQKWHRNVYDAADEVTAQLGAPFAELISWAAERELLPPLVLGYHILGLDPKTVAIGNLIQELTHPESRIITSQWDDNPVIHELHQLAEMLAADESISKKYTSIAHRGGVRKNRNQFINYSTKTFLLTLITNPLADTTGQAAYIERRRLRIWLLGQAANRLLEHDCAAERSISSVARFLVMDAVDEHWKIVDELLKTARRQLGSAVSFEQFTTALGNAARALKDEPAYFGKTYQQFLNSVAAVANGECRAIATDSVNIWTYISSFKGALNGTRMTAEYTLLEAGDSVENMAALASSSEDEEEDQFYYVSEVDPTDSQAQQILSSGSVYIQTMELSHYLPWSWERVLPTETQALETWVTRHLSSQDCIEQAGAAMVWLAMQLARSLSLIERLSIELDVVAEWSFTPDLQCLERASPRRRSAWRPSDSVRQQVAEFRDDLTIVVPRHVTAALQVAKDISSTASTLGDLWRGVSKQKLDTWFNEQAGRHFPRLTSAKLSNYQSQRLFDATGQSIFARLLSSHPNGALPGACSYATWDIKAIEKGLQLPIHKDSSESDSTHIMGSLLAPMESVLVAEIQRCNEALDDAVGKGLIPYHNALAQYVVMALYAATGARPLRDPFESIQHFSSRHRCVFINDKNDEGLHNGRLVPLPAKVMELLNHYLHILSGLSRELEERRPDLAVQVTNVIKGRPASLPLFFLLDDNLRWHSMADADRLGCMLFEWALPANLFRHRYSQRLLEEGVEQEVIEGWMGHAERGTATYSDYSARCWVDDADIFRAALERAYDVLPFKVAMQQQAVPPLLYLPVAQAPYAEPKLFGQKARAKQRWRRIKAAVREAHSDMRLFLDEQPLQEISDEDLLRLSNRMLLRENHLPHPQAALRFRILLKEFQKLDASPATQSISSVELSDDSKADGRGTGYVRRQLLRKRLVEIGEEQSLISPSVTAALDLYEQSAKWAEKTRKTALKASLSKAHALCVGTALLVIEKRLGYEQMLLDVVRGENFRLLQNKRQYFIEYSETLEPDDFSTAVQRHEISYKTASLLAHGLHRKKSPALLKPTQIEGLSPLLKLYSDGAERDPSELTMEQLLSWLCKIINQANLVQLPGIVAAALSERAPPTSASLRDQTRLLHDRALDLSTSLSDEATVGGGALTRTREQATDKLALQQSAKEFSKEITAALQRYEPAQARQCAQELRKICDGYKGRASSSLVLAGYWIAERTGEGRGKKRKKRVPYARNTLTTYWSTISPAFRGLLYDVDLVSQDGDDVTDLCAHMLDYKYQSSRHADYFGKRLQDFFRWAARSGVATPEWTELNIESGYRTVSSGLISEPEYQTCLKRILADMALTNDQQLMLGFILLLAYRFGLRAKEAIGLLRRDWCCSEQHTWVLVQNNQYRTLKSKSSRRAIPLLFTFSEVEQGIVERTLARYASIAGKATNRPVLCEASGSGSGHPILTSMAPRISEALIHVIRSVTGNPELVLHHCRHSFYNRVAPALYGIDSPLAGKFCSVAEHSELRRTILGPVNEVSRRSAMAMARLMGHRFPSTALKTYFHLATDWADMLTPVIHQRARKIGGIIQITELPTVADRSQMQIAEALQYPPPDLVQLFQTVRLVSLGMGYDRAGELMRLHPQHLNLLQSIIVQANARMRFSSTTDKTKKLKGEDCPNALIESITDAAWQRLIHRAEELKGTTAFTVYAGDSGFLEELPFLVSLNRHILMEQTAHCYLVRTVVDLFAIPASQYQVVVKHDRSVVARRLADAGFKLVTENDARIKLDGFPMFIASRGGQYRIDDYGGLVLSRSKSGIIRNSLELAVALLVLGVLNQIDSAAQTGKDIIPPNPTAQSARPFQTRR